MILSNEQIADRVKSMLSEKKTELEEVNDCMDDYILDNDLVDINSIQYQSMARHSKRLETEISILEEILEINQ
jgi:hypothetical protein